MSMPRCVAIGTALSVSLCIVYGLSMGDFDLVMCIISHLEGLKVICRQSRCPGPRFGKNQPTLEPQRLRTRILRCY